MDVFEDADFVPFLWKLKHQLQKNTEKIVEKSIIEDIKDLYCMITSFFFVFANVIKPHEHMPIVDDELEV